MHFSTDIAEQAAFFRTALYLGIVRGEAVIAWADGILAAAPAPDHALIVLAMTPQHDLSALRHALLPLSGEMITKRVADALLDVISTQWRSGQRSFGDTMTVLAQFRGTRLLPPELAEQLRQFEFRFRAWPPTETTVLEEEMQRWFSRR